MWVVGVSIKKYIERKSLSGGTAGGVREKGSTFGNRKKERNKKEFQGLLLLVNLKPQTRVQGFSLILCVKSHLKNITREVLFYSVLYIFFFFFHSLLFPLVRLPVSFLYVSFFCNYFFSFSRRLVLSLLKKIYSPRMSSSIIIIFILRLRTIFCCVSHRVSRKKRKINELKTTHMWILFMKIFTRWLHMPPARFLNSSLHLSCSFYIKMRKFEI